MYLWAEGEALVKHFSVTWVHHTSYFCYLEFLKAQPGSTTFILQWIDVGPELTTWWANSIQLIMRSYIWMVTWYHMIRCSTSTVLQNLFFKSEIILLQMAWPYSRNLCWNSLIGTIQMCQIVLFSSRDTSGTRGSARPYCSRVGLLVAQPELAAESFLALRSTQNSLLPSQKMDDSNTPKYRMLPPKPKQAYQGMCFCLTVRSIWCNNSAFTFNKNAPACLTTLEPIKMSLMWQVPESF